MVVSWSCVVRFLVVCWCLSRQVSKEIPTNSKSQIHTVNGNISLKLSNKVSLKLKAKTINGEISSEFPGITAKNGFVGNKIEATIGKQNLKKALVNIKAINGKVLIQKG